MLQSLCKQHYTPPRYFDDNGCFKAIGAGSHTRCQVRHLNRKMYPGYRSKFGLWKSGSISLRTMVCLAMADSRDGPYELTQPDKRRCSGEHHTIRLPLGNFCLIHSTFVSYILMEDYKIVRYLETTPVDRWL